MLLLTPTFADAATVTTGPPTEITTNSMTFNWTYDGPSSSYSVCKRVEIGNGSSNFGTCSAGTYPLTITGLSPNTAYRYRAIAAGVSECPVDSFYCYGEFRSFRTLPVAVPVMTLRTGAVVGDTSADLFVLSNSVLQECWIDIGETTAYGRRIVLPSCPPDEEAVGTVPGLTPSTTYHARLGGRNTIGSSTSSDVSFATSATAIPTTIAASDLEPFAATLRGSVNPNGAAGEYWFEYGLDRQYGNTTATHSFSAARTSVKVSAPTSVALIPGRTYHFRLVAKNAFGTWAAGDRTFATPSKSAAAIACEKARRAKTKARRTLAKTKGKKATRRAKARLALAAHRVSKACR